MVLREFWTLLLSLWGFQYPNELITSPCFWKYRWKLEILYMSLHSAPFICTLIHCSVLEKKGRCWDHIFPWGWAQPFMSQFSFQFFAAMNQRLHAAFLKQGGRSETTFSTGGPIWRGSNLLWKNYWWWLLLCSLLTLAQTWWAERAFLKHAVTLVAIATFFKVVAIYLFIFPF